MFPQRIGRTAFTEPYTEGSFRVDGVTNISDVVLVSVLRALLNQKLVDEDRYLHVRYDASGYSHTYPDTEDHSCDFDITKRFFEDYADEEFNNDDTLTVVNMSIPFNPKDAEQFCSRFSESFLGKYGESGWVRQERISEFFKNAFCAMLFTNETKRSTIVCVSNLDASKIHYVTCTLFAWFPWYFKKGEVGEEEKALLHSLSKDTRTEFEERIASFEDRFDFYSMKLKSLEGVEKGWIESEKRAIQGRLADVEDDIRRYYDGLADKIKAKESLSRQLIGFQLNDGDSDNSVMEFFGENRGTVVLTECNGDSVEYEVKTYLEYWDPDMAETFLSNKRSVLYEDGPFSWTKENREKFFKALFVDCDVKLRFCAAYRLRICDMKVDAMGDFSFTRECKDYFPNTHINKYRCLGGYEQSLLQSMQALNYCGAIEQTIASAKSLNFGDSTVMSEFVKQILNTSKKCIEMKDGKLVSPSEWIKIANGEEDE